MTALQLETQRLVLVACTPELITALDSDRASAGRLLAATLPDGWPDDELGGLLAIYAPWVAEDPSRMGYGPWVVTARNEAVVVGSAGFQGTPKEDKSIEIGFGTHPEHRNRGYAAEAAEALLEWGLAQPTVARVVAKCDPNNVPSVRVLEKIGMNRLGETDGMLLWEALPN